MRTNAQQVIRAAQSYGQRRGENKRDHNKVVPKTRTVQGKGSLWARHYHDATEPMETYVSGKRDLFT